MQRALSVLAFLAILAMIPSAASAAPVSTAPAIGDAPSCNAVMAPERASAEQALHGVLAGAVEATCTLANCSQAAAKANNLCHVGIFECLDNFTCDPANPCAFTYSCQPC
jgi:hypothetical protein